MTLEKESTLKEGDFINMDWQCYWRKLLTSEKLRPGATEEAIAQIEKAYRVVLPASYKGFLQATNGIHMGAMWFVSVHNLMQLYEVERNDWSMQDYINQIDEYAEEGREYSKLYFPCSRLKPSPFRRTDLSPILYN